MPRADIYGFEMQSPADMSGLREAMDAGHIDPARILCVLAKTEGNGLDNDHTRSYATDCLVRLLGERLGLDDDAVFDRIGLILSGGVEGVTNPHMTVVTVDPDAAGAGPALAAVRRFSRTIAPEEIGRLGQVEATAEAMREAMDEAGMTPDDVVYVLAKGAVLMPDRIVDADRRGAPLLARDTHGSKPFTRAATALGIAVALGEVECAALAEQSIGTDMSFYTERACVTPGVDRPRTELVLFGNSPGWSGDIVAASAVLADAIDAPAAAAALARAGLTAAPQLSRADRDRLLGVIVKGEPSRTDLIRGRRHVMWRDSDVHALRQFRASMAGMLAGLTGDTRFYIAAGAEHQGPAGGGTMVVFARK